MEGLTNAGFPPVPPLDHSFIHLFGVEANVLSGRRPALLSTTDQLTAAFTDRSHQCAFQVSAAANNISLQVFAITKIAAEPGRLAVRAFELGNVVSASSSSAHLPPSAPPGSQHLIGGNMWLQLLPSIPDDLKTLLLEGPINSN